MARRGRQAKKGTGSPNRRRDPVPPAADQLHVDDAELLRSYQPLNRDVRSGTVTEVETAEFPAIDARKLREATVTLLGIIAQVLPPVRTTDERRSGLPGVREEPARRPASMRRDLDAAVTAVTKFIDTMGAFHQERADDYRLCLVLELQEALEPIYTRAKRGVTREAEFSKALDRELLPIIERWGWRAPHAVDRLKPTLAEFSAGRAGGPLGPMGVAGEHALRFLGDHRSESFLRKLRRKMTHHDYSSHWMPLPFDVGADDTKSRWTSVDREMESEIAFFVRQLFREHYRDHGAVVPRLRRRRE